MNRYEILKHPERKLCTSEEAEKNYRESVSRKWDVSRDKAEKITEEMKKSIIQEYMQTARARNWRNNTYSPTCFDACPQKKQ